jgi:hypothetical protein
MAVVNMTKRTSLDHDSGRQAGAPSQLEKLGQSVEGILCGSAHSLQGRENGLSCQRLSLIEGYIEGVFDIVLKYRNRSICQRSVAAESAVFHLGHNSAGNGVGNLHGANRSVGAHWKDALMLIGDIEPMEIPKIVLPAREGLNFGSDVVANGFRGSVPGFYMSVDGAFDAGPVAAKRKSAEVGSDMPIRFDENAVCVIKRSPKIMECITKDGWRMALRLSEPDRSPLFECALLMLGAETFSLFRDVSPQKPFELIDVMIGPFYLQQGPGEIALDHG